MAYRKEDRPTVAEAIWAYFQEKFQPTRLTMSSAEFQVISGWMDRGIPLTVILRALEDMTAQKSKPRTLMACVNAVDDAYRYWSQAMGLI